MGVLAFEMLSGQLPFEGPSTHQVIYDIMHTPPPSPVSLNPSLDAGINSILQQALAKDPAARFRTAGELAQALYRLRATCGLQLVNSAGESFPLSTAGTSLGRDPDNDIVFEEIEVSRYHARIYCEAATWFVMDLGSTNGTCLNELQLKPNVAYPVSANDTLRLGYTIAFRVVASDKSSTTETKTTNIK
jgi:serine/threonine protein kinase